MSFSRNMQQGLLFFCALLSAFAVNAQENTNQNKFRQLKQELATPNVYRTASGAPGHEYYQQQADYVMDIEIDDEKQRLSGVETITYHNNSPDELRYLWVQLDQNMRSQDSDSKKIAKGTLSEKENFSRIKRMLNDFDGGFKIEKVTTKNGRTLSHTINKTMMRVDLPSPLKAGSSYSFKIKWWYNINNRSEIGGRSGYEFFEEDGNYLYTIAQFYPRMAVYNEVEGWQNKQFLGSGEFAVPFGDYKVNITVPSDHVVASTGSLQNASKVLSSKQRKRFESAKTAKEPVMIVNEDEAIAATKNKSTGKKTWTYYAENVRDFAFASSRKFIWDAIGVKIGGKTVMAMSYFPTEGDPLWGQYSTKVVAHTIKTYSKYTVDYNYPVAISVHTDRIGMEYPMICFNGGRPESDGTYSANTKHGMISVIIHEVGHNFFPMIINSDERQWTWMDEGLNTFVQYLTEMEWDIDYPSRRGPAYKIVDYMKGDKAFIAPIMTNSESIYQFGNNAYGKPATALNILRETVMGRELFDYAFKEYCRRWAFKHPTPADFFRTMEDASAVDLDWFWRGWFYTTDHVDLAIANVKWYQVDTGNPEVEKAFEKAKNDRKEQFVGDIKNQELKGSTIVDKDPDTKDFYNEYDPYEVDVLDKQEYQQYLASLTESEKTLLKNKNNFYEIKFESKGGLLMPVILEFEFIDGSREKQYIPAEIWMKNDKEVSKIFVFEKELVRVVLDPNLETADTDRNNNYWPAHAEPSRFKLFKQNGKRQNLMQRSQRMN